VGDIFILFLLLIYSPTIIFWIIAIHYVCKVRAMLFCSANAHTKEMARRSSIGIVVIASLLVLALNTLLIVHVLCEAI
jgi:hypothetical protein